MKLHLFFLLSFLMPLLAQAQTALFIGSGTTVTCSGSATVTVKDGKFTNNSTNVTSGTSNFVMTGTATTANSTLGGSAETTFHNLEINKSSNNAQLQQNVTVKNQLKFTAGHLDLNNKKATITSTSSTAFGTLQNESGAKHCIATSTGTVEHTKILNAPSAQNPANLGAVITSTKNLGSTKIERGHQSKTVATGISSISRFYKITPTTNTALAAKLRLHYFDDELPGGVAENTLVIWRTDNNGSSWSKIEGVTRNGTQNWVETNSSNNQGSLSMFTLAPATAAASDLPGAEGSDNQLAKNAETTMHVFPNPTDGTVNVEIVASSSTVTTLNWFDSEGRLLKKEQVSLAEGKNVLSQHLTDLPSGTLFLKCEGLDVPAFPIIKQ